MRILELSTPEIKQPLPKDELSHILSQIETLINQSENLSRNSPIPANLSLQFRQCLTQLTQLGPNSFSNSMKLQLWKMSYRLWNACVDLSNSGVGNRTVEIRQIAAEILDIAGDVAGVPSLAIKAASFYYKTGLIWHEERKFEFASNCFEKATDLTARVEIDSISDVGERRLLLDLNIARAKTAWEVSERNVSVTLLNRSKKFLFDMAENYKTLSEQYLSLGKSILVKENGSETTEALKLMNEGLEICERGLRVVKKTEETLILKSLKDKTLRFIAALHLQREEYESVIKCVRVLRDHSMKISDQHPSLSVLAMKAWLGLERFSEAEKELREMVLNKGIPEGVWVSAVEAYFKAVGIAAVETVKSVFLGLLGRCQVSAGAAVRVIYKVIGDGGGNGDGLRIREKMAAELAADERVVVLFSGDVAAKERTALHAVLWNCAAAHFRSKDYKINAELFEKAMLYVPSGVESRILQAKGYRVLCLCHLGLSQLDQAQEYIDEAEKLLLHPESNGSAQPSPLSSPFFFKYLFPHLLHMKTVLLESQVDNRLGYPVMLSLSVASPSDADADADDAEPGPDAQQADEPDSDAEAGDESESDDEEDDVHEDDDNNENNDEDEDNRSSITDELPRRRNIPVEEWVDGGYQIVVQVPLGPRIRGYTSLAARIRRSCPRVLEAPEGYNDVAHIGWPWMPDSWSTRYFGPNELELDPFQLPWLEFYGNLTRIRILPDVENHFMDLDVININLVIDWFVRVPRSGINSWRMLLRCIHLYNGCYFRNEPDDDLFNPWPHGFMDFRDGAVVLDPPVPEEDELDEGDGEIEHPVDEGLWQAFIGRVNRIRIRNDPMLQEILVHLDAEWHQGIEDDEDTDDE